MALSLSVFTTKGNNLATINQDGVDILRKLPRPLIETAFSRLLNHVKDDSERATLGKLFQRVTGPIDAP